MYCKLLSDGTYKYTYDNAGNMTSQTDIATGSVTYYTWDYRNRLVEVKQESSSGTVLNDEKFTYDVFNNRIAVSLNGTPELYTVYDGSNPYLDFNGSGQLTERYLYNPNALSQFYGQVNASGAVQWFLTDNINSIRQVVSSSGTVLDAITYDPYGNILSQTNAANAPRFLYVGGTYDSLTGYDQFGRRYYDPSDGRWTSQDPLGFKAGDTNLYRYVGNAPIDHIDLSGLQSMGNDSAGSLKLVSTSGGLLLVPSSNSSIVPTVVFPFPLGFPTQPLSPQAEIQVLQEQIQDLQQIIDKSNAMANSLGKLSNWGSAVSFGSNIMSGLSLIPSLALYTKYLTVGGLIFSAVVGLPSTIAGFESSYYSEQAQFLQAQQKILQQELMNQLLQMERSQLLQQQNK